MDYLRLHACLALLTLVILGGCKKDDKENPVPEKTVAEKIQGDWDVIAYKNDGDDMLKYYVEDYRYDPDCSFIGGAYYEYIANGNIEMFFQFNADGSYKNTAIATYDELYDYDNFYGYCQDETKEVQSSEIIKGDWSLSPNDDRIVLDPESGSAETFEIKSISEQLFELTQSISNGELTMSRPQ